MRLSQFIRILWVHRGMCFGIFLATLALALAASFLLPKKYTGEAAVVVDERGIEPLAQQGAMQGQLAANFVATQVDVIGSHNVALKVVDRMKLVMDPEVIEKFKNKTGGVGSIRDWEAEELLKSSPTRSPTTTLPPALNSRLIPHGVRPVGSINKSTIFAARWKRRSKSSRPIRVSMAS